MSDPRPAPGLAKVDCKVHQNFAVPRKGLPALKVPTNGCDSSCSTRNSLSLELATTTERLFEKLLKDLHAKDLSEELGQGACSTELARSLADGRNAALNRMDIGCEEEAALVTADSQESNSLEVTAELAKMKCPAAKGCNAKQPSANDVKGLTTKEFWKLYNVGWTDCDSVYHHHLTKDLRHAAWEYKKDPSSVTDGDVCQCAGVFYFALSGARCGDQRKSNNKCNEEKCYFMAKYGKCEFSSV